jgi:hypothetical protein
MSPSRLSPRGTSLIEAMAAMVVFTVGILGVMQMNVLASRQNNLARTQTTAAKIARDVADSLGRLPFNPLLNKQTTFLENSADFKDMSNNDGLVTLQEAIDMGMQDDTVRPVMGAFDSVYRSDGDSNFYKVAWRARQIVSNPDRPGGEKDQIRILVMVSFPTGTGVTKQIEVWAIKANPKVLTGADDTLVED